MKILIVCDNYAALEWNYVPSLGIDDISLISYGDNPTGESDVFPRVRQANPPKLLQRSRTETIQRPPRLTAFKCLSKLWVTPASVWLGDVYSIKSVAGVAAPRFRRRCKAVYPTPRLPGSYLPPTSPPPLYLTFFYLFIFFPGICSSTNMVFISLYLHNCLFPQNPTAGLPI